MSSNSKLIALATSALLASSVFGQVPAAAPATAPSADVQALMQDFRDANKELSDLLPDNSLADADKRKSLAPKAVPLLKRINSDLDQVVAARPAVAPRLATSRQQVAAVLAALGDPDAVQSMQKLVDSPDAKQSLKGRSEQMLMRWYEAGQDPAAQTAVADDLEKLDQANLTNNGLTLLTMQLGQTAATPDLKKRLQTLAMDTMKSPASAAIKKQRDTAAAKKTDRDTALGKLLDKPMTITGTQPDGKPFTTADWKGKVVLVDFWATWCAPCKAELPRTKKIYDQYHPQGLELLGVSNDYQVDALKKFVVEQNMPWPEVVDTAAAADQQWNPITLNFGINAIPTMFLIDKKGVARSVTARQDMETLIPKLLAEQG